jgi:hypothetical protein
MKSQKKSATALVRAAAITVASFLIVDGGVSVQAGTETVNGITYYSVNTAGPVLQGTNPNGNNPPAIISFSGQTALKNFNISGAFTYLQPGTSITLHDGTNGAPVIYTAPTDPINQLTSVQLASNNFGAADYWQDPYGSQGQVAPGNLSDPSNNIIQVNSALVVQWHTEGSIDGFYDLINDEVGFPQTAAQAGAGPVGPISNESLRDPSSANATYLNTNSFTAPGSKNGFTLNNVTNLSNTYSTLTYNQTTGQNLLGGQNRNQFSVGEYPTEALAVNGSPGSPFAAPGSPGYGTGNPALSGGSVLTALGVAGAKQQFQPSTAANEGTNIDDPNTGATYAAGPWNTAGANNITSIGFAATAVTYSANPGTGLERLNKSDTQWLQTTGRLQNGALFNVVARTADTGQRAVFALNTGIDPTWAVGSNDDGNSTSTANANAQHSIGPALRFDGKTSGTEAEITIAQSRMAVGALSLPEAQSAPSYEPVRALDIDFNSLTDPTTVGGATDDSQFVRANFNSIVSSDPSTRYQAVLISHYNVVKSPNATALDNVLTAEGINPASATAAQQQTAWALVNAFNSSNLSDPTASGIKGDTTGDVAAVLSNLLNSNGTAVKFGSPGSSDPADGLFSTGYLIPGLLDWTRQTDGGAITPVTLTQAAQNEQSFVQSTYGQLFTSDGSNAANGETNGTNSFYGIQNASGTPAIHVQIPITSKNSGAAGNYLFGNFNQNGVRDFSAVQEGVNAALSLSALDATAGGKNSIFTPDGGVANNIVVPSVSTGDSNPGWVSTGTNTKGDLIVLGDYNGDGRFDGQDLYLLATGASLADNTSSGTLTATASNFADVVRNPNNVLRKNAALDYVNSDLSGYLSGANPTLATAAGFLFQSGRAVLTGSTVPSGATDLHSTDPVTGLKQFTYDPTGANAFNKTDINRDGVVDLNDAVIVDNNNGNSYTNLTQSLAATIPTPVSGAIEPVSLVTVQQVDGLAPIGSADLAVVNTALTGIGNANFYGYNVQKTGPGTIDWERTGGTVTVYAGASLEVSGGSLVVGGTVDPFSDNTVATATSGNHVALAVDHGASVALNQSVAVSALTIDLASNSKVDIGRSNLTVGFTGADPAATLRTYLKQGYNGGIWTGTGLTSSAVAAEVARTRAAGSGGVYGIGYVDGSKDNNLAVAALVHATGNQIVYTAALIGDANLDGSVTFIDLGVVAQNLGAINSDWQHGDFNYDGTTNFLDIGLLAQNLNKNELNTPLSSLVPDPSPALTAEWNLAVAEIQANSTVPTDVPEPGTISLLAVGAAGLLARRRRAVR